jgi:hypothetical protein
MFEREREEVAGATKNDFLFTQYNFFTAVCALARRAISSVHVEFGTRLFCEIRKGGGGEESLPPTVGL